MNTVPLPGALPARRGLVRFIVDHNPFYLLSALCMLGGLLTLTNSHSYSPIPQRNLLILIGTLNGYELLLVGLGLWLIVRRNLLRDGSILLGIEALFLADTAMLNAELFTVDRLLGAAVNCGLLLLAAAKLSVIFRALRVRSPGAYGFILANLFLLFAMPGAFKQFAVHHNGGLSVFAVYIVWWIVGMIPLGFAYVFRRSGLGKSRGPQAHGGLVLTFVAFTAASILVHLRLSNWVYQVPWESANLSPLLLGLAVCVGSLDDHVRALGRRMAAQLAIPVLAVVTAMQASSSLFSYVGPIALTPMRFAFLGAMLVYLHGLWLHRHVYFGLAVGACFAAIGLGGSPELALHNLEAIWNWQAAVVDRSRPRSATDWGVLSVIASFVLLLMGAGVSVFKGAKDSGKEEVGAAQERT
jgi:hypothetical protein